MTNGTGQKIRWVDWISIAASVATILALGFAGCQLMEQGEEVRRQTAVVRNNSAIHFTSYFQNAFLTVLLHPGDKLYEDVARSQITDGLTLLKASSDKGLIDGVTACELQASVLAFGQKWLSADKPDAVLGC